MEIESNVMSSVILEKTVFDVIVIGGGIIGAYTANELVKEGKKVLLVDQFPLPHSHGSSKGRSRGVDSISGVEEPLSLDQMRKFSLQEWRKLYDECPEIIRLQNKLYIGKPSDMFIKRLKASASSINYDGVTFLGNSDLRLKFPQLKVPDDFIGILEQNSFALSAEKILDYLFKNFVKGGGNVTTANIEEIQEGYFISVKSKTNIYLAKKVLVATGPWSNPLLQNLGVKNLLKLQHVLVGYWKINHGTIPSVSEYDNENDVIIWNNSTTEYGPAIKIVMQGDIIDNPQEINTKSFPEITSKMMKYVQQRYRYFDTEPFLMENCMISKSADKKPLIGQINDKIFICLGMSGYGFGIAPAFSDIMCDLICSRTPKFDFSDFNIKRFSSSL